MADVSSPADSFQQATVNSENPWPGLSSFTEDERNYFHGRERETQELLRLIKRKNLSILFGKSGIGKTSILNAGVFPQLRGGGYLPIYIRLNYHNGKASLIDQIKERIRSEFEKEKVEHSGFRDGETLWEYFHREGADFWNDRNRLVTPILVLDQFEELFSLGYESAETHSQCTDLMQQLADLIENRCPRQLQDRINEDSELALHYDFDKLTYKIVICMREDFVANLEDLKYLAPSVMVNRFRLQLLNGARAKDVVLVGRHLIDDDVADQLVQFVAQQNRINVEGDSRGEGLSHLAVEPALLSLICRELNNQRKQKKMEKITKSLIAGSGQEIIEGFYKRSVQDIGQDMERFIEDRLINASGFRNTIDLEDALKEAGVTRKAIELLTSRRVLRVEERFGRPHLELIHDKITAVVKKMRDLRREQEDLVREKKRQEELKRQLFKLRMTVAVIVTLFVASVIGALWGLNAQKKATQAAMIANTAMIQNKTAIGFASEYIGKEVAPMLRPAAERIDPNERAFSLYQYYAKIQGLPLSEIPLETKLNIAAALLRSGAEKKRDSGPLYLRYYLGAKQCLDDVRAVPRPEQGGADRKESLSPDQKSRVFGMYLTVAEELRTGADESNAYQSLERAALLYKPEIDELETDVKEYGLSATKDKKDALANSIGEKVRKIPAQFNRVLDDLLKAGRFAEDEKRLYQRQSEVVLQALRLQNAPVLPQ